MNDVDQHCPTPPHSAKLATVMLAGGASTRFADLGYILPKPLLAVSGSQTLLSRLLDQVHESASRAVVISTSPRLERIISPFVEYYMARRSEMDWPSALHIKVFANSFHSLGPVPALVEAIRHNRAESYLLCLSDIFFSDNPFKREISQTSNVLFTSPYNSDCSGVVFTSNGNARRMSYRAVTIDAEDGPVFTWTGAAKFSDVVASDLLDYPQPTTFGTLEDSFNWLIERGHKFELVDAGSFINVNNFAELVRCQQQSLPRLR